MRWSEASSTFPPSPLQLLPLPSGACAPPSDTVPVVVPKHPPISPLATGVQGEGWADFLVTAWGLCCVTGGRSPGWGCAASRRPPAPGRRTPARSTGSPGERRAVSRCQGPCRARQAASGPRTPARLPTAPAETWGGGTRGPPFLPALFGEASQCSWFSSRGPVPGGGHPSPQGGRSPRHGDPPAHWEGHWPRRGQAEPSAGLGPGPGRTCPVQVAQAL